MVGNFKSIVDSYLPIGWERMLGMGLGYFISEQDPEQVYFDIHDDGYSIVVKTDEENVKQAAEFWQENVQGRLGGNE